MIQKIRWLLRDAQYIEIISFLLKIIGLHPVESTTVFGKLRKCVFLSLTTMGAVGGGILLVKKWDGFRAIEDAALYPAAVQVQFLEQNVTDHSFARFQIFIKHLNTLLKSAQFRKLYAELDVFWPNRDFPELSDVFRKTSSVIKTYLLSFMCLSSLTLNTFIFFSIYNRKLPLYVYSFCDETNPLCYTFTCVWQYCIGVSWCLLIWSHDGMIVYLAAVIYNEIEKVKYVLKNICIGEKDDDTVLKELCVVMSHHAFILR